MPPIPTSPTIEDVTNLCRVFLNDTVTSSTGQVGGGRVFTDNAPFILPLLNQAVFRLSRDLRRIGWRAETQEVVVLAIPVIYGANGNGNSDPAAQQNLNFTGFFNGNAQIGSPVLPPNLITPLRMWQRTTGTNNLFADFQQNTTGLVSGNQANYLGQWEWRGNAIWWNGSVQQNDIRLRFNCTAPVYTVDNAPPADFPNIVLPFIENAEPIAAFMSGVFAQSRPLVDPGPLFQMYADAKDGMASEIVRGNQGAPVSRQDFDSCEQGNQNWE